jgi:hypothetical protein
MAMADSETQASGGGDSMAARLSRQRQERSKLRTSNLPLEEAADSGGNKEGAGDAQSELKILRAEVAASDRTIQQLQSQLKQSEVETEEMGSRTARMATELRELRERADAQQGGATAAPAAQGSGADGGPMQVSICMPENVENPLEGVSVRISISGSLSGEDSPIRVT